MTAPVLYARQDAGTLPVWHRVDRLSTRHGERLVLGVCGRGFVPGETTGRRPPQGSLCCACRAYEDESP